MTEKLYYGNQYQTEGTATVLACRPVEAKQNAAACWEVVLDLTVKNEGDYVLSVTASDLAGVSAAIDGEAVPLDAAGRSQPIEEWGGGSDAVITITVPAGVTVSHIGYAKG